MHGIQVLRDVAASPEVLAFCTLFLTGLFLWAGIAKMRAPYASAVAMVNLGVLQRPHKWAGSLFGAFELFVGLSVPLAPDRRMTAVMALLVVVAFTALVARSLQRGDRFPCGCFGDTGEVIGIETLRRASIMTLATVQILLFGQLAVGADAWFEGGTFALAAIAAPSLVASMRQLRLATRELDEALDWKWILQRRYTDLEPAPQRASGRN